MSAGNEKTPPQMEGNEKVILFDGICKLCNAWCRFIIRYDKTRIFRLASVQSIEGQRILQHFHMPIDSFDTMLYVEGNIAYTKSDAFLKIISKLDLPWNLLYPLRFIPRPFRDWCYDRIALNRYALFGKYETCLLPDPDHEKRFLK